MKGKEDKPQSNHAKRLLLVGGDKAFLVSAEAIFSSRGFCVTPINIIDWNSFATSLDNVVPLFDVIIVDFDSVDFIRALIRQWPKTSIIALTPDFRNETVSDVRRNGIKTEILQRPFMSADEMISLVSSLSSR